MDLNLLKQVFPEEQFTIEFVNESIEIHTTDESAETFCAKIKANTTDTLEIQLLSKCGISGKQTLKRIEEFARLSGFKKINLSDMSQIEICGKYFKLEIIKILTNGQSWYNSLGYISNNYEKEIENNRNLIQKTFNEIFTSDKIGIFDTDRKTYFRNSLKKILNISEDAEVDNLTLQSIVKMVVNVANICGNKDARNLLQDLINFIDSPYRKFKIIYNPDLTKNLGMSAGAKSKRSVTKAGGKKKIRRRKTRRK